MFKYNFDISSLEQSAFDWSLFPEGMMDAVKRWVDDDISQNGELGQNVMFDWVEKEDVIDRIYIFNFCSRIDIRSDGYVVYQPYAHGSLPSVWTLRLGVLTFDEIKVRPTFHLNLHKEWFDMILSGEKAEEYRAINDYWSRRFIEPGKISVGRIDYPYNQVDIIFSNGYHKSRRQMKVRVTGMRFESEGKIVWGAEKGKKYFVLELGKVTPLNF